MARQLKEDYLVVENADQTRFVMPRRPTPLIHLIFNCFQAICGIFPACFISCMSFWEANSVTQSSGFWEVIILLWVFGLILSYVAFAVQLGSLGRAHVRLSRAGLESGESLGPVRFWRSRSWKSLLRIAIDVPSAAQREQQGDVKTRADAADEPASLLAHFSDKKPLTLVRLYPQSMLVRLAKDVARASARFGSGQKVLFDSPPLLVADPPRRAAVVKPLVVTPAPRGSKLFASKIAAGGVRITIGKNLPVAVLCGILLTLALAALLSDITGHTAWLRLTGVVDQRTLAIQVIIISTIASALFPFALVYALTTRIFEADRAGLSRTTEVPLGRHSKRWNFDEIAGIDVITSTTSGGRGGSHTVHTLELRRKAGQTVELVNLKKAELEWMGDLLSAALRIPRT